MKSPQSHFILQMFLLFHSRLCDLAGPPPTSLPNGGSPWIFLREATPPLHPGGQSKPNLANGCASSSDHNHWFDGPEVIGVNTRNVLEHLDKGAQLVESTSGEAGSHLRHYLGIACLRMKPAQGMQNHEAERGTFSRLKK